MSPTPRIATEPGRWYRHGDGSLDREPEARTDARRRKGKAEPPPADTDPIATQDPAAEPAPETPDED